MVKTLEPYEEVTIDVRNEYSGSCHREVNRKKRIITSMHEKEGIVRMLLEIPTRGLLGYRGQFVVDTRGEGILASRFIGFKEFAGEIKKRDVGSMTSWYLVRLLPFHFGLFKKEEYYMLNMEMKSMKGWLSEMF
jgi:GTP-binding protein